MAFGDSGKFDANQLNPSGRVGGPGCNGSNVSASNGMTPVPLASPTRFVSSNVETALTLYNQDGTTFIQYVGAKFMYPIACWGISDCEDTATLTFYE